MSVGLREHLLAVHNFHTTETLYANTELLKKSDKLAKEMLQKHNNQNGADKLQTVLKLRRKGSENSDDSESDSDMEECDSDDDYFKNAPEMLALKNS